ncbi:MAG: flagellar filament capping protein FliD [Candidatus Azotimanducaceae bacterium]
MAVDYVNALGAGSSMNTKEIVTALVEAERAPKEASIQRKVDESESKISGLATALSALQTFQASAQTLNDLSDFNSFSVGNSQTTAFTATASTSASSGSHTVEVTSVARAQRSNMVADGPADFTSTTQTLNSGTAFDLTVAIGPDGNQTSHTVSVTAATPAGIVSALNAADLGITARLTDVGTSGTSYKIQLTGESGTDKAFSITPSVNSLLTTATPSGQTAANADLTVDGLQFSRASNSINDIIPGVTLDLNAATSGAANMSINQDTSAAKTKITDFVTAYNIAKGALDEISSFELDGAFAGDSLFRAMGSNLRSVMVNDSSTPGTAITRLSDLGISINRTGEFDVNDAQLDLALAGNFTDLVTIFSADTTNQTEVGDASRGIAGDISKLISDLTSTTGYISTQTASFNTQVEGYQVDLEELETRMERIEARYTQQFLAMQQIVDEMTRTREDLISSFENLPFTNKD